MDLYAARKLFNLPSSYTKETVNKTYRKLMMKWHPDVNKSREAEEKAKQINEAKDILIRELNSPFSSYSSARTYSAPRRNFYVDTLKSRIGKYNESDLNPILLKIIWRIESIIDDFENWYANKPSEHSMFSTFSEKIDKLFINYASWFCNEHKLKLSAYVDRVFIDSSCIIFKDLTLIEFVEHIDNVTYDIIYSKYCKKLTSFIGSAYNNTLHHNDKNFSILCSKIANGILDFENKIATNYSKKVKVLDDTFSKCILNIYKNIDDFIIDYCRENELHFTHDNTSNIFIIEGIEISHDSNIFGIYNNLVSLVTMSKLKLKNMYNEIDGNNKKLIFKK